MAATAVAKMVVDKTPAGSIGCSQYRDLDRLSMLLAASIIIVQINSLDLSVGGMAALAPIHATVAATEANSATITE